MNYQDFQNAITSAPQAAPPTTNPALASLFGSSFQLAQSNRGAQGLGAAAGMQAQYDAQAQEQARQQKVQDIKDKIQAIKDQNDPNKYQKMKKEDGGFDFYDPSGNKIPVQQYAQAQGKPVADVLKDSENNLDIQFQQDYGTLQSVVNAYANGDKKALAKIEGLDLNVKGQTIDPKTKKPVKSFFDGKKASDIMSLFRQGYPNIYTPQVGQSAGVRNIDQSPGFAPLYSPQSQPSQPGLLQKILGLFGGQ
jgi:hypothetical protein